MRLPRSPCHVTAASGSQVPSPQKESRTPLGTHPLRPPQNPSLTAFGKRRPETPLGWARGRPAGGPGSPRTKSSSLPPRAEKQRAASLRAGPSRPAAPDLGRGPLGAALRGTLHSPGPAWSPGLALRPRGTCWRLVRQRADMPPLPEALHCAAVSSSPSLERGGPRAGLTLPVRPPGHPAPPLRPRPR